MFHVKLAPGLISEVTGINNIDQLVVDRGEQFCALLLDANKRINLISRAGDQPLEVLRQFLISIAALPAIPDDGEGWWLDIGSGGGFPAIPLALFRAKMHFVLADSMAKKAFFLERTVEAVPVPNVRIINTRVEAKTKLHPRGEKFDWLSVKAVTDWEETLRWGNAFLKEGGSLLTYKTGTPSADEMLAIADLGFELHHTFDLSDFFDFTRIKILILRRVAGSM